VVHIVTSNFCTVWGLNPGRRKRYFLPHPQSGSGPPILLFQLVPGVVIGSKVAGSCRDVDELTSI
jgi:hypothetical protein